MKKRGAIISRILFVIYLVAVCYLCFHSFSGVSLKHTHLFGIRVDKVIHFAMFLPFMELLYLSLGKRFTSPLKCVGAVLLLFAIGCSLAVLTELCQDWFTVSRVADVDDFKADTIALMVGAAGVFLTELLRKR